MCYIAFTKKGNKVDLSKYYARICKFPKLTKKEEIELIRTYKNTRLSERQRQIAKAKLLSAHLRFCFKQAKYFSKNDPFMFEELLGAANEGLAVGLEKFDPAHKKRFLTYAGAWVKQKILKTMSQVRIVSLPLYRQQLATRIRKYQDKNGKATIEQLKKVFPEEKEKDLIELSGTRYLTYYMEDLKEESPEIEGIAGSVEAELDSKNIREAVYALPSPHKEVLILSFGFEDGKEASVPNICKRMILTRDQLKQVKKEAIEKLKQKLSSE